ncbi:MAG: hypothetical protein C0510_06075 [Erythrobacter sp.]|nr:hypothetical protein [Erythrobacter sp.]
MADYSRFPAALAFGAVLSMAATPVAATEISAAGRSPTATIAHPVFDADAARADNYRHYRYRHHRNHISTGDVLAGVLIIGGIAAIANAASRNDANRRYPDREPERDYDYRDRRGDARYDGARGIDRAVNMCVTQVERDVRVDSVDSVDRTGEGWRVAGTLYNGEGFTCHIGSDGRIDTVDYAGFAARGDRQLGDDRYRAAWANVDGQRSEPAPQADEEQTDGPLPAYPGGPLPGESADDRYQTGEAPGTPE